VAKIIVEQVLTRLGVPYAFHSDQGTQFESRLFGEVCKLFGIKKTRTTPYHPKSEHIKLFKRTTIQETIYWFEYILLQICLQQD
jgi:transposase InsO family protein